jgi:hypothetical protein
VATLALTIMLVVIKASDLAIAARVKTFVEIAVEDLRRRTESVKQDKDAPRHWDAQFFL